MIGKRTIGAALLWLFPGQKRRDGQKQIQSNEAVPLLPEKVLESVPLIMDSGWQSFHFGNYSDPVERQFTFNLSGKGYLWVTDAHCKGDSFLIYDNQRILGETADVVEDGCKTNATDPSDAVQNGGYGHVYFNLTEGTHSLSFLVKNSPFLAGTAFLRLDSEFKTPGQKPTTDTDTTTTTTTNAARPTSAPPTFPAKYKQCLIQRSGLYIFTKRRSRLRAGHLCASWNLQIAQINSDNLLEALKLAYDCLGPKAEIWIGRYQPDARHWYHELRIGERRGTGRVAFNYYTGKRMAFMCQDRRVRRLWHSPRYPYVFKAIFLQAFYFLQDFRISTWD